MKQPGGAVLASIATPFLIALFIASRPSDPPAVYSLGAAYDEARGRLVIFGGTSGGVTSGATWEWDGTTWTAVSQAGPAPRNSPAMAYDSARRRVVLFGGDAAGQLFGDTWEWDGSSWTRLATSGPRARTLHRLTYDAARQRTMLFGGFDGQRSLQDTWEWDGSAWTQVATSGPPARIMFGMAYDTDRHRTIVFGGSAQPTPGAALFGDTWEWDGTSWREAANTGPGARDHAALAYDKVRRQTILFGGHAEPAGLLGDTWTWNGAAWKALAAPGPTARAGHQLVYSPTHGVLLYGGFAGQGPLTELWSLQAATWKQR
jgi:hypothetical protein